MLRQTIYCQHKSLGPAIKESGTDIFLTFYLLMARHVFGNYHYNSLDA